MIVHDFSQNFYHINSSTCQTDFSKNDNLNFHSIIKFFNQIKMRVAAESTDKTLHLVPTRHFTIIKAGRPPLRTIDFKIPNINVNRKKNLKI